MRTRLNQFVVCITAIAAIAPTILPAQVAENAPRVSAEQRLPAEVFGYLSIPDVKKTVDRWQETLTGQMLIDPKLADFRDEIRSAIVERVAGLSADAEKNLGVTLDELIEIPSGEVTFAIAAAARNKIGGVVLVDFGENGDRVEGILERLDDLMEQQDVDRLTEEIDGTEVITFSRPQDPDNPRSRGRKLSWFIRDSYLAVSTEAAVLNEIIARWDGDGDNTLASNDVYSYIVNRCSDEDRTPQAVWFVNPMDMMRTVLQSGAAGDASLGLGMAMGMFPTLGLDRIRAFGGTVDLATDEYDSVMRTLLYIDPPTTGVLNAFQFESEPNLPPGWIAATASGYFSMNWRIEDAFETVGTLLDMFRGPGFFDQVIEKLATDEGGPQVHIKRDLIDQLSGRIQVYSDVSDEAETGTDRTLVALSCRNEASMQAVIDKLAHTPGLPLKQREYRGKVLYEVPNPQGADTPLGLSVVNGMLLIASDMTLLEQVMRGEKDQEGLADSREFRRIVSLFPERTSIVNFQKQDVRYRPYYEAIRNGNGADVIPGSYDFFEKYDFSTLPPFDEVRKYLPASGMYAIPDEKGVYSESFTVPED